MQISNSLKKELRLSFMQEKPHFNFYIKEDVLESLRKLHNWPKRGFSPRLAELLGVTRQALDPALERRSGLSTDMIGGFILLCGLRLDDDWAHLFDVEVTFHEINSMKWNYPKYNGEMGYLQGMAYEFRRSCDPETELWPESKDQILFDFRARLGRMES